MITAIERRAMESALEIARLSADTGEVPVGAVILDNEQIVATRGNERQLTNDPTAHAEILVLRDASNVRNSWNLSGCTLVVTLEPCVMCAGAILAARISRLIFGAFDPRAGGAGSLYNLMEDPRLNHNVDVVSGVRAHDSTNLLVNFFKLQRQ